MRLFKYFDNNLLNKPLLVYLVTTYSRIIPFSSKIPLQIRSQSEFAPSVPSFSRPLNLFTVCIIIIVCLSVGFLFACLNNSLLLRILTERHTITRVFCALALQRHGSGYLRRAFHLFLYYCFFFTVWCRIVF